MTARREAIFSAFLGATLARGIPYWWRPRGFSMRPAIADGDRVLIAPARPERLRVGDIVKFRIGDELRMHRLVRRSPPDGPGEFVFRGDSGDSEDTVRRNDIIGLAVAVERNGRLRRLDSTLARGLGWVRAWRSRPPHGQPADQSPPHG